MAKYRSSQGIVKRLKRYAPYIALVLLAVFLASQIEQFVRRGTLLGYQVRTTGKQQASTAINSSGSLVNPQVSTTNKPSLACSLVPINKASGVLKTELERISGFVADKPAPSLVSSCIYRAKDKSSSASVAVLIRDLKDSNTAKKDLAILKQSKSVTEIKKLGDSAYFNSESNQLTVQKGKRVIAITVPNALGLKVDNKTAAIAIAKLAL